MSTKKHNKFGESGEVFYIHIVGVICGTCWRQRWKSATVKGFSALKCAGVKGGKVLMKVNHPRLDREQKTSHLRQRSAKADGGLWDRGYRDS